MRRLYPNVTFDWKKITAQLAKKREVCRRYRSRRQDASTLKRERQYRCREPFIGVVDPLRGAVYVNDERHIAGALLDALIAGKRGFLPWPSKWFIPEFQAVLQLNSPSAYKGEH